MVKRYDFDAVDVLMLRNDADGDYVEYSDFSDAFLRQQPKNGTAYDEIAVAKIWQILGIKNYEQAQGKSIDRLVADLKQQWDDLLEGCKAQEEAAIAKCKI